MHYHQKAWIAEQEKNSAEKSACEIQLRYRTCAAPMWLKAQATLLYCARRAYVQPRGSGKKTDCDGHSANNETD
jgi:hypothetical protein